LLKPRNAPPDVFKRGHQPAFRPILSGPLFNRVFARRQPPKGTVQGRTAITGQIRGTVLCPGGSLCVLLLNQPRGECYRIVAGRFHSPQDQSNYLIGPFVQLPDAARWTPPESVGVRRNVRSGEGKNHRAVINVDRLSGCRLAGISSISKAQHSGAVLSLSHFRPERTTKVFLGGGRHAGDTNRNSGNPTGTQSGSSAVGRPRPVAG